MLKGAHFPTGWRRLLPLLGVIAGVVLSVGVVFAGLPARRLPSSAHSVSPQTSARPTASKQQVQSSPRTGNQPRPPVPQSAYIITSPPVAAPAANPASVLYDQYDHQADYGISSQNFEPSLDRYDDQAADDFQVPQGQAWVIDHVEAAGAYLGSGPASSANVIIYADGGSRPGQAVFTQTNTVFTPGPGYGDLVVPLDPPATLPAGVFWVSVQANQNFMLQFCLYFGSIHEKLTS